MIQSVKELFEAISDEQAKDCRDKFILKDIHTNHLLKHWIVLACILHRCFDGNKGGIDQISFGVLDDDDEHPEQST